MRGNNLRQEWQGVYTMIEKEEKKRHVSNNGDDLTFANDLNTFYARFDTSDFSTERNLIRQQLDCGQPLVITAEEVCRTFKKINPRKAVGPDRIRGRVLKECREKLSPVFGQLFQMLLDTHHIPRAWKTSLIVPVLKMSKPTVLNDYQPVALTSIVMKSLERIVLNHVLREVQHELDPLQFAYRNGRSTEDALLYMLHNIYCHLDWPKRYAPVLFVDFLS